MCLKHTLKMCKLNGPTPGINIVKDADGTVRKELYRL